MTLKETFMDGIDRIFSRKMLGSVLVGAATTKVLDYAVIAGASATATKLLTWGGLLAVFVLLFIYWDRIERGSNEFTDEIGAVAG